VLALSRRTISASILSDKGDLENQGCNRPIHDEARKFGMARIGRPLLLLGMVLKNIPNNVQLEEKEGQTCPKKERRPEQLQASDRRSESGNHLIVSRILHSREAVNFLLTSTDRGIYRGRHRYCQRAKRRKNGVRWTHNACIRTPIGEIDSPKLKLSLKGLNSLPPDATHLTCCGTISVDTSTFLWLVDGFFTGNRYFFYGAFLTLKKRPSTARRGQSRYCPGER